MSEFLNTKRTAEVLGLSPWTLIKWRSEGRGPKYVKFGVRVRYRRDDLAEFAASSVVDPDQSRTA